jgi:hypothetical protein
MVPSTGRYSSGQQATERYLLTNFLATAEQTLFFVRFEVYTAVTMKNGVFWDIKTQFVLHRRHITSPLQSPAS